MQAELTGASRHEHLVLYDPAAIPADTPVDPDLQAQDPRMLPATSMMQLASRGQALVLRIPGEDCAARFRLFVNEEPPEQLRSRGQILIAGATLQVPGGRLRADGLEFLCRGDESRQHSEAEDAPVPSGQYALEVLSLLSWKLTNRAGEGRRGIGPLHGAIHVLVSIYTWLGILMFPANLFGAPLIVAAVWRSHGWQGGVRAAAIIVSIDAVLLAGFWGLEALRKRSPGLFRVAEADAAFETENPDVVVVLRAARDGAEAGAAAYAEAHVRRYLPNVDRR
jgi:hypothetical protein